VPRLIDEVPSSRLPISGSTAVDSRYVELESSTKQVCSNSEFLSMRLMHSKNLSYGLLGLLAAFTSFANAEEVHTQLGDITLNADRVVAEGNRVTDEVVVVVHGTLGHKDMDVIQTLQEALQDQGYNSLAINLSLNINDRHGFYPCDKRHTHLASDADDEIAAWIGWLHKNGAKRIMLMGHSLGANQVAKFGLSRPEGVAALVALAPPLRESTVTDAQRVLGSDKNEGDWLVDIDFLHCENATVQVASYLSYTGPNANNDTLSILEKIKIPTLVISGTEDFVVRDLSSAMETVSNELVQHAEIDGAGHFFRDLYAYEVIDAVTEFFGTLKETPRLIEMAISLQDDARLLSVSGKLLVVFVSQSDCRFCAQLRQQVLYPAIRSGDVDPRIELREVSLDESFNFKDFQGVTVTGAAFAERYSAYVTPTLLFLDGQGNSLVDPLVGIGNIEFYDVYLKRKIEGATKSMKADPESRLPADSNTSAP
jgi:pimeloyl-ACP methyl ester carboxylesterase